MTALNPSLVQYIETQIFPRYAKYYSHGLPHIHKVITDMLMLADYYHLDPDMTYTIGAFHDIGLDIDRDNHEHRSGQILAADPELRRYFSPEQLQIMCTAVEDHRGSRRTRPRNIYGECLSDADRDFDIAVLAHRQLATSLRNYPELGADDFDSHFERCHAYICQRINDSGQFNLWTDHPTLIARRDHFQRDYLDKPLARSIYRQEWDRIQSDGTIAKILNYYQDY